MSQLRVMKDFSECVPYDDDAVPFYIGIGRLSYYPSMKALGHWHDDIEIMKALHGHFSYKVFWWQKLTVSLSIHGRCTILTQPMAATANTCAYYFAPTP